MFWREIAAAESIRCKLLMLWRSRRRRRRRRPELRKLEQNAAQTCNHLKEWKRMPSGTEPSAVA